MSIFKSYDIRGEFPSELNEEVSYKIGKLLPKILKCKNIVIGYDIRTSSKPIFKSLAKALLEENIKVTSIGYCTTPMLYFSSFYYKFDAAVMITASHLSKDYNGFKICTKNAIALGYENLGKYLEKGINNDFEVKKTKLKIKKLDIFDDYEKFILKNFKKSSLKVAIDSGNMMGYLDSKIISKIAKIKTIYNKPDGSMPNHMADPLIEENLKDLKKFTVKNKCNLGISFDGDSDRVGFIDEKGSLIKNDIISALISKYLQKETILIDPRSSKIIEETYKGKTIRVKAGHTNIKKSMREYDALFASELSGHFFFREFNYCDSALFAALTIIKILDNENKSISELVEPLKKYYSSGELNFEISNKDEKINYVENYFKGYIKKENIDGISLYFKDFWFNLRKSNTENLLRLNIETNTKQKLEEIKTLLKKLIIN